MKDERIRIKIAEACGFTHISVVCWRGHLKGYESKIPDYPNDLNSIHEVEKMLAFDQYHITFLPLLQGITQQAWVDGDHSGKQSAAHATAHQRCEAFLRTLDLWEK